MDFYIIFFILALVTSGAINIGLQVSLQDPVSILFEYMLRSETTRIYGSSELIEKLQYCLVAVPIYITINSAQGVPIFSHPTQHLLILFHANHSTGMRWCLIVVVIWISLTSDVGHIFMYLLAIYMAS